MSDNDQSVYMRSIYTRLKHGDERGMGRALFGLASEAPTSLVVIVGVWLALYSFYQWLL